MLGLRRNTVKLCDYSESWVAEYYKIKSEISHLLKNVDNQIEHVGSTSICHVLSKPILDIAIGVKSSSEIENVVAVLTANGFEDRGDKKNKGGYLVTKSITPEIVSHHIHILELADPQWNDYLKFRDTLRSNQALSIEYRNLKIKLLEELNGNRIAYTSGKNDFIRKVLDNH